jgi:hypothetical protein
LADTGNIVGYDPFFNAGYVGGVIFNGSARLPAALAIILKPWFNEIVVYKLHSFIAALVGPLGVPLALLLLERSASSILLGDILGIILWWVSFFRWFHTTGMVSFVFASYLTLPCLAVIFRYLNNTMGWRSLVSLVVFGTLLISYHPLASVPIIFGTAAYLMINWRRIIWRRTPILFLLAPTLSLLPNLYWLSVIYHYQKIFELGLGHLGSYQQTVDISFIWKELFGWYKGYFRGSKLYAPLLIAAIWACLRASKVYERRIAYILTVAGFFLILFAAIGGSIHAVGMLEPNRFSPVGYLFLIIPGTIGIVAMLEDAFKVGDMRFRVGARAILVLLMMVGILVINEVRREVSYADIGHYGVQPPEVKGLGDYSSWVLNFLARETTTSGRVLFEDSKARIYDGAHIAGYYAYQADREFIGGPFPFHHFAGFWDSWVFRRPIEEISYEEFEKYMDLYNIGWIIAHSEKSKHYFDQISGVRVIDTYKELKAYRIERSLNYFIEGKGRVLERNHNKLRLSDLSGDVVIVKYHFVSDLKSEPPAMIVSVKFMDDPNPFIKILNPPKEVTLYLP